MDMIDLLIWFFVIILGILVVLQIIHAFIHRKEENETEEDETENEEVETMGCSSCGDSNDSKTCFSCEETFCKKCVKLCSDCKEDFCEGCFADEEHFNDCTVEHWIVDIELKNLADETNAYATGETLQARRKIFFNKDEAKKYFEDLLSQWKNEAPFILIGERIALSKEQIIGIDWE